MAWEQMSGLDRVPMRREARYSTETGPRRLPVKHSSTVLSPRAGALALAFALVLCATPSLGVARARAASRGSVPTAAEQPAVAVDTSEIPDFEAALAEQLSIEATAQAKEFGFDPSQITITIVWLDAASASYGIHVYIETKDAKLPDGPRGPMLNSCEQCSQKRVPEAAVEALTRGFELYEDAKKQRKQNGNRAPGQGPDGPPPSNIDSDISKKRKDEPRKLRRQRAVAAVLLTVGGAAHVVGITLMALWKDGHAQGLTLEGRQYYIPGTVLLSLSPAPIAAGAVVLAGYVKAKKKPRATLAPIGLRRGLGLGATIRF